MGYSYIYGAGGGGGVLVSILQNCYEKYRSDASNNYYAENAMHPLHVCLNLKPVPKVKDDCHGKTGA